MKLKTAEIKPLREVNNNTMAGFVLAVTSSLCNLKQLLNHQALQLEQLALPLDHPESMLEMA